MKILICGLGSIGKRHANNLIHLKKENLIFFRERNHNLNDKKLKKKKTSNSLIKSLSEKPDVAFICNTTSKHIDTAIACAKKGCHLFIEKPLSNNLKKIKILESIVKKKKIKVMIGYNMRFHPLMIKIKKLLENNQLGHVYNIQSEWSEYLPDWHPWENYKDTYAAKKNMGGGCSLTLSHELDSMYWLFGKIKKVKNFKIFKYLDGDIDTSSDFLIEFNNKAVGYSHIDFLGKPHIRKLYISGTRKKIFFNYYKNQIKIINRSGNIKVVKVKFKKNDMYIEEVKYFLKCIKKNISPSPSIQDSKYILKKFLSLD
jgi:predicted dehydrogenase|tara:strand:- start:632 stop:1573 length:942 start_codon:yes stop_codon:yes gene_type:complete